DEDAIIETTIERDFIRILEGGCQVPIGVNAEIQGTQITVKAILGLPDGSQMIVQKLVGNKEDYKLLGQQLAQKVIDEGAKELLKRAETIALNEIF
ncbi:MAG: hydroxymethylbilane synthase, partial [Sulfurospirillaceae bacterium]|nr:hydroxymethylbilane synthase [Sulfurospirillaceae bacterium]